MLRLSIVIACLMGALASSYLEAQPLPRAAFMGVQANPVTEEMRAMLGLSDKRGVRIAQVFDGGSAKSAGLREDDVIIGVDDAEIDAPGALVAAIAKHRAGDTVTIRYARNAVVQSSRVTLRPRPFETSDAALTEYDSVLVHGTRRRTIMTLPRDESRHPALLYMTGIGCASQESLGVQTTEAKLLHGLSAAGYITMRVEKSGVGDSEGPPCASPQVDLHAEVAAYVEGLKALKAHPRVDPGRVFLLGLSLGGIEAPIVARTSAVNGVIVVNTASKPFLEYLLDTRRRQGLLRGTPYAMLERRLAINERCNHALLIDKQSPESILRAHDECREYIEYPAPHTLVQQWADLNMAELWDAVDVPVLIVQGESDFVATVSDAPYLRDIIDQAHPGQATLRLIPDMDHFLTRAGSMKESMSRSPEAPVEFNASVLDVIRGWLAQRMS